MTILWHRTSPEHVESILREGLLRRYSRLWKGAGGCVYLSTTPDTNFGEVLLEIDADGLELAQLSEWECVSWQDIPPERIRIARKEV